MSNKRLDLEVQRQDRLIRAREGEADAVSLALRLVENLFASQQGPEAIDRTVTAWMQARSLDTRATRAVLARIQSRIAQASSGHLDDGHANWQRDTMQNQTPRIGSGLRPSTPRADAWQVRMANAAMGTRIRLDTPRSHWHPIPADLGFETVPLAPRPQPMQGVHALQLASRDTRNSNESRLSDVAPEELLARLGSGRPLPERLQLALHPRLQALGQSVDLARVRIHDDGDAEALCTELRADGFAVGYHVVLARGPLREDAETMALLVHELTHVWQQSQGAARRGFEAASHLEARAEHAAETFRSVPLVGDENASETDRLVARYSEALGLDPSRQDVRTDAEAAALVRARGLAGLMEDGIVRLDPDRYDPATASGRALLAHEMVHVAQREGPAGDGRRDLLAAEVEAHTLGARLEAGLPVAAPQVALATNDAAGCSTMEMNQREPETVPQEVPEIEPSGTTETVTEPPVYRIVENRIEIPLIHYQVDKDRITETQPDARPIMKQLADTLKMYPEITKVRIEGFTSTTGSAEHNLALSQRRAARTKDWLRNEEGVQQVSFETEGHGEETSRLRVQTGDGVENDENRRTEITIVEVEGRPAPPNWQPSKKVLVSPGRTIIRHLDAEGQVVREEVVESAEQPSQGLATGGGGAGPASRTGDSSTRSQAGRG